MKRTTLLKWMVPACLLAASPVWAAYDASLDTNFRSSNAATSGVAADISGGPQADGAFGLAGQDFWVGGGEFTPRDVGGALVYNAFYHWSATGAGATQYEAQFQLPNGANMQVLRCFFNNTGATTSSVGMWRQYITTADVPAVTNLATVSSTASAGYHNNSATPSPGTFQSRSNSGTELNMYTLIANLAANNSAVQLRGCRIFYSRQISPAPATATFSDVPVGSQFFAEVEALAASGITAGCAAGQFCPGGTLTRLQMAAFLARALGLHWPAF